MIAIRTLIAASLIGSSSVGAVSAQTDPAPTELGVLSTETAPNTTAVGQTKPPSRDAGPTSVTPIERPTPEQVADDAIAATVCQGCRTEPATADPLTLRIRPSVVPEKRDGERDARLPAAEPRLQSDLDTVALASAHRERADSAQEKTNGLWQSWLVSVCDGCGDQKPARGLKLEDWPNREGPPTTGSVAHKASSEPARREVKPAEARPRGSLEADLSPENLGSIRRMPQP